MLRLLLLGFACLLTIFGIVFGLTGEKGGWSMTMWGVVLLVAVLCERWRYQRREDAAGSGEWQETGERYVDPESGRLMQVLYQPATGDRRYVLVNEETH